MSFDKNGKRPYICGPLTELDYKTRDQIKAFYVKLANVCRDILHVRGFVPHEVYDPIKMANVTPKVVFHDEREIVTTKTSVLIVCALEPTWGGGMEVAWANEYSVPIIILAPGNKKLSRLLIGGPMVFDIMSYSTEEQAVLLLKASILDLDEYYAKRNKILDSTPPPAKPPQAVSLIRNIQKDMQQLNLLAENPFAIADWHKKITDPDSSR
jgi:hypothetical protein